VSTLDFQIKGYNDDPDILAKSQFVVDGQAYEVIVVAASAPATTNKYIPDVIDLEQEGDLKRMLVCFDGDRLKSELDQAITQAKEELAELEDTDNYAAHVGTAGASVITLWLNRSMEAAKTHIGLMTHDG